MNNKLQNNNPGAGKNLTRKMKIAFFTGIAICAAVLVLTIKLMLDTLNPPAVLGEMTIKSSGETVNPYTNVLYERENKNEVSYKPLDIEDIVDDIPGIVYDGDIVVNYSEYTLDDFTFDMYDEDLNCMYEGYGFFDHPEEGGDYYVRICFSWGYNEKNVIKTENFFKVTYTEESLSVEHHH